MIFVCHRKNSIRELSATPAHFGVEVDIRCHGQDLVVVHDPFVEEVISFDEWLESYHHAFLIANVKEEGLEPRLLPLLKSKGIENFFILDESFPFIRKYSRAGVRNFAVRVSEFEGHDTALRLQSALRSEGRGFDWVWVDTFTGSPLEPSVFRDLREAGLKICIVSPELHHVDDTASWWRRIRDFRDKMDALGNAFSPDMVCTKSPEAWAAGVKAGLPHILE
jgi:hypothetical protein